jgi:6-phosphogluconate dehydrogenase
MTQRAGHPPTTVVRLRRDIFGAHTYRCTDRTGDFHREWAGDGSERVAR